MSSFSQHATFRLPRPSDGAHRIWTTDRRTEFVARCSCGWEMLLNSNADALNAAHKHEFEHRVGSAQVECLSCGDRLPVSQTVAVTDAGDGTMAYQCEDCAAVRISPVDPEMLRADLLDLERELRQ